VPGTAGTLCTVLTFVYVLTDEREEARLFYVGATRATQRLVIGASGSGTFAARL
jgi:hypothetical protein